MVRNQNASSNNFVHCIIGIENKRGSLDFSTYFLVTVNLFLILFVRPRVWC